MPTFAVRPLVDPFIKYQNLTTYSTISAGDRLEAVDDPNSNQILWTGRPTRRTLQI